MIIFQILQDKASNAVTAYAAHKTGLPPQPGSGNHSGGYLIAPLIKHFIGVGGPILLGHGIYIDHQIHNGGADSDNIHR